MWTHGRQRAEHHTHFPRDDRAARALSLSLNRAIDPHVIGLPFRARSTPDALTITPEELFRHLARPTTNSLDLDLAGTLEGNDDDDEPLPGRSDSLGSRYDDDASGVNGDGLEEGAGLPSSCQALNELGWMGASREAGKRALVRFWHRHCWFLIGATIAGVITCFLARNGVVTLVPRDAATVVARRSVSVAPAPAPSQQQQQQQQQQPPDQEEAAPASSSASLAGAPTTANVILRRVPRAPRARPRPPAVDPVVEIVKLTPGTSTPGATEDSVERAKRDLAAANNALSNTL